MNSYLVEKNAARSIDERAIRARLATTQGRAGRRTTRHSVARGLHRIADALDT